MGSNYHRVVDVTVLALVSAMTNAGSRQLQPSGSQRLLVGVRSRLVDVDHVGALYHNLPSRDVHDLGAGPVSSPDVIASVSASISSAVGGSNKPETSANPIKRSPKRSVPHMTWSRAKPARLHDGEGQDRQNEGPASQPLGILIPQFSGGVSELGRRAGLPLPSGASPQMPYPGISAVAAAFDHDTDPGKIL